MPMVQLIRRDGGVIELEATNIQISVQRKVLVHAVPLLATRAGLDLNIPEIGITVDGIFTDDEKTTGAVASEMSIDLSLAFGAAGATSWHGSLDLLWSAIQNELDGVTITFRSKGQLDAGLGEKNRLYLSKGSATNVVGTTSIIYVDISSTTNTDTLSTAIKAALDAASVKVAGATVGLNTEVGTTQSAGQAAAVSYESQNGSAGTYNNELIAIRNLALGEGGNSSVIVEKSSTSGSISWDNQFFVTNMSGGVTGIRMTRGDKLQDLLNMVVNPSVGGALISPQVLTGSLIDLPDSIASMDSAQFLRLDQTKAVKKYIVGIRIPYETLLSSTSGNRELRQFLIPAGPGTDYSAASNTGIYDPVDTVNNKAVRPNPFLQQGVAIPAVVTSFDPGYEAGDSVWTYQISLAPLEQLVGL